MSSLEKVKSLGYEEIENVGNDVRTTILYRKMDIITFLTSVQCSGEICAMFIVMINKNKIMVKRAGPSRNVDFVFHMPLFLAQNDEVAVSVIHYRSDQTADFECGIFGYQ